VASRDAKSFTLSVVRALILLTFIYNLILTLVLIARDLLRTLRGRVQNVAWAEMQGTKGSNPGFL
jgi:hypothetical protein